MGVVRLEVMILQEMPREQVVSIIFNEQMRRKRAIILNHSGEKACSLSFTRFMN